MDYLVALKKSKEGVAVWCPGLPGCWSQGETEEAALTNIEEAIRLYLEVAVQVARRNATSLTTTHIAHA